MGFSPAQVGEMSMWEFLACADGIARKNGGDDTSPPEPMSYERLQELRAGL